MLCLILCVVSVYYRLYYQLSKMVTLPTYCQNLSSTQSNFFSDCYNNHDDMDDLQSLWTTVQSECRESFSSICNTMYTDNPPFACSIAEAPDIITVFSNAFAGTEFLYVIFSSAVVISLSFWHSCCRNSPKEVAVIAPEWQKDTHADNNVETRNEVEMQKATANNPDHVQDFQL